MDWMTEKNPVFDLVISQASKLSQPFWRKAKTKDELGFEKNFCQFNFIERIYGLAGPPQQLEFVTVPPAPRDLSSSFPFFFLTKRSFTQRCTPLCAFNDVCHYEYYESAHKTVCYIPFHLKKNLAYMRGVGREVSNFFLLPQGTLLTIIFHSRRQSWVGI